MKKTSLLHGFLIKNIVGPRYAENREQAIYGIEIENEFQDAIEHPRINGWEEKREGSLRGYGFEYAMKPPRDYVKLRPTLDRLFKRLSEEETGSVMLDSPRCSTHVHLDVSQYSYWDMVNFALVYWIVEEFLVPFAGEHRRGNHFCLSLPQTGYVPDLLAAEIIANTKLKSPIFTEDNRYSSLNFASVCQFGSLEFRLMRGVSETKDVMTWVDALTAIRTFALKFKTPKELFTYLEEEDIKTLLHEIFDKDLRKALDILLGIDPTEKLHSAINRCMPVFRAYRQHVLKYGDYDEKYIPKPVEQVFGPIDPVLAGFRNVYYDGDGMGQQINWNPPHQY